MMNKMMEQMMGQMMEQMMPKMMEMMMNSMMNAMMGSTPTVAAAEAVDVPAKQEKMTLEELLALDTSNEVAEKPTASKRQAAPTTSRKPECHGPRTPSVGWADFAEATHCPKTTAYLPPNTANLFSTVK